MIRFLFRFIGLWVLAGAFVTLVIDGTRSVSASNIVYSPVRDIWTLLNPASLAAFQARFSEPMTEPMARLFLVSPFFLLLAVFGLLFLLLGRRKRHNRIGYSSRD